MKKELLKTKLGKMIPIISIAIIIIVFVGAKIIEKVKYNDIAVIVSSKYEDSEKTIKSNLKDKLLEYQNKYGGTYLLTFGSILRDSGDVELTIAYDKDAVSDNAVGLPKILYKYLYEYASYYMTNPLVSVKVIERQGEGEDVKTIASTDGNDNDEYVEKQDKIDNPVKITDVDVKYKSGYYYVTTTILNNTNRNIDYVKINLYYKDEDGNIIKSEWTNDSATIKPGASQKIEKMTKDDGWTTVSCEIDEVSYE